MPYFLGEKRDRALSPRECKLVPSRWYKFTLVKEQSYAHERTTQKSA